jgi:plastocyanin
MITTITTLGARGLLPALLVALATAHSGAATLFGTVHAEGRPDAEAGGTGGKYDSREFKFVERVNYAEMRDFIVYIEGPAGPKIAPPEKPAQVITRRVTQEGAIFSPHVLPVLVGTTVEWPNNDKILHNVFSFSETKPFDLELYKAPVVKSVTFDKAGRVDVFCSIHTRMNCILLVLENPYFAAADAKGGYSITNVPAGSYKLKAWHERLPPLVKDIVVPESGQMRVDFTLGFKPAPKS